MFTAKEKALHEGLLRACGQLRASTEAIVVTLIEVARTKLYQKLRRKNLVEYIVEDLRIDSTFTFDLNRVVRAALDFPEVEAALKSSKLSVGKATRILTSLTPTNAQTLVDFACRHTFADINAHVAETNPEVNCREQWKQLSADQFRVTLILNAEQFADLKRSQSLEAQRQKVSQMSAAVGVALKTHLAKHDPKQKAGRAKAAAARRVAKEQFVATETSTATGETDPSRFRSDQGDSARRPDLAAPTAGNPTETTVESTPPRHSRRYRDKPETPASPKSSQSASSAFVRTNTSSPKRKRFTAWEKHQVTLKSGGQCMLIDQTGRRCECDRWLDVHHLIPVSEGGTNEIDNLVHLCGAHHDLIHQLDLPFADNGPRWTIWRPEEETIRCG